MGNLRVASANIPSIKQGKKRKQKDRSTSRSEFEVHNRIEENSVAECCVIPFDIAQALYDSRNGSILLSSHFKLKSQSLRLVFIACPIVDLETKDHVEVMVLSIDVIFPVIDLLVTR